MLSRKPGRHRRPSPRGPGGRRRRAAGFFAGVSRPGTEVGRGRPGRASPAPAPGNRDTRAWLTLEGGVFGGGADKNDGAVLDEGEHGVLLRLVEAMDLIDEQQCGQVPVARLERARSKTFLRSATPGKDGRDGIECEIDPFGDEPGDGGLAGSGAAPRGSSRQGVPGRPCGHSGPSRFSRWSWPTTSSSVAGRMRSARWPRHPVFKETRQAPVPSLAGGMPWCTARGRGGKLPVAPGEGIGHHGAMPSRKAARMKEA